MIRTWQLVFSIVLIIGVTSCKSDSKKVVTPIKIEFKKEGELTVLMADSDSIKAKFDIEIADDDYQRETGLMHRQTMEDHQAMLFIFPDEEYRSFFMKNTYLPLDIIYLDKDGEIVSFQYDAKPLDETSLPSNIPAQYVLEIKAGLSEKYDIQIDDKVIYSLVEN